MGGFWSGASSAVVAILFLVIIFLIAFASGGKGK